MTGLIDTHAHLYEPEYAENTDGFLSEIQKNGVEKIVCVGCDIESCEKSIALAESYDFIYAATGFHPCDTADISDSMWERMQELCRYPKVVAVGEIGLDFHWDDSPRHKQIYWFECQLEFAKKLGLPVVIHSREATEQTIEILKKHKLEKGVFHCFSGSVETLRQVLDMNFSISLGGVVTFKNARRAVECAAAVPLDRLMLETDCPYMAPEPFRGKTNRPDYTVYVAQKIGQIRGMSGQEIADITRKNAELMFGI